jgi:hypothetical protein
MPDDDTLWELRSKISTLTNENAELKVVLLDAFVALARSVPRQGNEQNFDQTIDRLIGVLGLSDDEINSLLGS